MSNNCPLSSIYIINYNIANVENQRAELVAKVRVRVPIGMLIGVRDHVCGQDILEKGLPK